MSNSIQITRYVSPLEQEYSQKIKAVVEHPRLSYHEIKHQLRLLRIEVEYLRIQVIAFASTNDFFLVENGLELDVEEQHRLKLEVEGQYRLELEGPFYYKDEEENSIQEEWLWKNSPPYIDQKAFQIEDLERMNIDMTQLERDARLEEGHPRIITEIDAALHFIEQEAAKFIQYVNKLQIDKQSLNDISRSKLVDQYLLLKNKG